MNFLDEIIQGIAKEYEKEKNKDQNYYGDELSSNITKIWSEVEYILEKNNNITIKEKEDSKSNKMNKDRITTDTIEKDVNKVKAVTDNRKDLKKGDIVRIVKGEYKGITKECKFLEYCKGMDKMLLQLDELNPLYVNPEDIELVRKTITQYDIKYSKNLSDIASMVIIDDVIVKNRGGEKLNLLVQTEDKIKIYCNDKINIMSYYHIVNNLNQKAKENIKIIKCWEE
ncbi:TPA: hypothetical protein ACXDAZ_002590 [Clostridium botulinum]